MATVGNVASTGYSASSYSSIQKELSDAKKEYADLSKNKNLTSEERTTMQKEYKDKIDSINDKLTAAEDEVYSSASSGSSSSNLLGGNMDSFSLFGNASGGQTGFDFFFGAQNTLSSLSIVNKARQSIESRARTLTSEIKMDKMRGIDTSGKEEALTNLTANVSLMDNNLSSNVNKALSKEKANEVSSTPIITQIKDGLKTEQKKLDAEFKDYQTAANKKNGVTETEEEKK